MREMECKSKFCGEEIGEKRKGMYKGLCYECSIGERVWRKIKKDSEVEG